ncbi:MAG: hypothetical protein PUE39_02275 [bacterium]|nr:hypothetical protein [bacterium]
MMNNWTREETIIAFNLYCKIPFKSSSQMQINEVMQNVKNMKKQKTTEYKDIDKENYSDLVAEPQYELFFNNGENERKEEGTLRVLLM